MQSTQTARSSKSYNPHAIARPLIREVETPEIIGFAIRSLTRQDGPIHHPTVCLVTGECSCDCEQFTYRLLPMVRDLDDINAVSITTPMLWCKHLVRAISACVADGTILFNPTTKTYSLVAVNAAPVNDIEIPAHIDPATGAVRPGWFQVVTPTLGFVRGQWVTNDMIQAARTQQHSALVKAAGHDYTLDD